METTQAKNQHYPSKILWSLVYSRGNFIWDIGGESR